MSWLYECPHGNMISFPWECQKCAEKEIRQLQFIRAEAQWFKEVYEFCQYAQNWYFTKQTEDCEIRTNLNAISELNLTYENARETLINSLKTIKGDVMNPDQMPVNSQCDDFVNVNTENNTYLFGQSTISIHFDDKTFVLEPEEDLTAYELWNINILIELTKLNGISGSGQDIARKIYDRACELKVDRHFKQK